MKDTPMPTKTDVTRLYKEFKNCYTIKDSVSQENESDEGDVSSPSGTETTISESSQSSFDKLMAMEGLDNVKDEIRRQIGYTSIMKMREGFGFKVPERIFHIILTGDPGTGKTTIARLIGKIFYESGLLSSGHTVETNRAGLVGKYIGESEANTTRCIEEARGGVLLIDEIYSLTSEVAETEGSTRDFGIKVIDTLIPVMSDSRSDLIVIGCGYKKQMEQFLKSNPGLASRFPIVLDFKNLTLDQLWNIIVGKLDEYDFSLSESGAHAVRMLIEKAMTIPCFGNGRFATTLVENYLIPEVCSRIYKISVSEKMSAERLKELCVVEDYDVPSIEQLFPLSQKKQSHVGFK